jgi:hypothetical protein
MLRRVHGCTALDRVGLRFLALTAFAFASPAFAQSGAVSWQAPAGCPSQAALVRRIDDMLAQEQWPSDLRADGRVTSDGSHYALTLTIDHAGVRATRSLASRSCETLAVTAAWLIAVSLDPDAAGAGQAIQDPATSAGSLAAAAAPSALPTASTAQGAQRSARVEASAEPATSADVAAPRAAPALWGRVGVFTGIWGASLPGPTASLGLRAGLGRGLLYVELRGAHMFAGTRRLPVGVLSVDSQTLGLAACAQWGQRLRGGPCATLSGLRTHAHIEGTSPPQDEAVFWGVAGAAANLAWVLRSPLELHAEAGLALPISARPRFKVHGVDEVEAASFLTGYGQLSVSVRLE